MRKIVIILICISLLAMGFWYFFLRSYDYSFKFSVKTAPGTVYFAVRDWSSGLAKQNEAMESKIVLEEMFSKIEQEIKTAKGIDQFTWSITGINDSLSTVKIGVRDIKNPLQNRISLLFNPEKTKQDSKEKIQVFKNGLNEHLKKFKIKVEGIEKTPEQLCACIVLESSMSGKADEMIANNALFMEHLTEAQLEISGKPLLHITYWNANQEKLNFDYCFPIKNRPKNIDLPLKIKVFRARKSIKASYFGNYRTSDRAWYAIKDYALRNNITVKDTPLEFYFNNPFYDKEELEWKTEVYFPIVE